MAYEYLNLDKVDKNVINADNLNAMIDKRISNSKKNLESETTLIQYIVNNSKYTSREVVKILKLIDNYNMGVENE